MSPVFCFVHILSSAVLIFFFSILFSALYLSFHLFRFLSVNSPCSCLLTIHSFDFLPIPSPSTLFPPSLHFSFLLFSAMSFFFPYLYSPALPSVLFPGIHSNLPSPFFLFSFMFQSFFLRFLPSPSSSTPSPLANYRSPSLPSLIPSYLINFSLPVSLPSSPSTLRLSFPRLGNFFPPRSLTKSIW